MFTKEGSECKLNRRASYIIKSMLCKLNKKTIFLSRARKKIGEKRI